MIFRVCRCTEMDGEAGADTDCRDHQRCDDRFDGGGLFVELHLCVVVLDVVDVEIVSVDVLHDVYPFLCLLSLVRDLCFP